MFKITNKQILAEGVKRLDIIAKDIAHKVQPGQFVIVTPDEQSENIPLTVMDVDSVTGTIALIFQEQGFSTKRLGVLQIDDEVFSILGPLGRPATIEKLGVAVCVATGTGAAQLLPICRALKKAGNKVIGIIGAKTKGALLLEPQMRLTCHKIFITTNDGSYERRGLATDILQQLLETQKVNSVYAIGSVDMMQAVTAMTAVKNIKTRVSLNPVMLDGMGLCGACRVRVNGKTLLACVDGPEFDGHRVDFEDLTFRMNAYKEPEQWPSRWSILNQKKDESTILTKFLSAIRKK